MRDAAPGAGEVARVISTVYFACATDMPEPSAVSAALKGSPEMEAIQHELAADYAHLMASALLPYSGLAPPALRLRCVGLLGAAEAIATELNGERTTGSEAVTALTGLIVGGLDAR